MRVGVLGGTFDPIHNGHLAIAQYAREKLELDKVLFVPAMQSPLKARSDITPVSVRLEMVKMAITGIEGFEVSTVEVDRSVPSYTVDTLSILKKQLGKTVHLFFILGWDALMEFPRWNQPEKLITLCVLVAAIRETIDSIDLTSLEKSVPGITKRIIFLDMAPVNVSSSEIRKRVAEGLSINSLVPQDIERYILEHGLYHKPVP